MLGRPGGILNTSVRTGESAFRHLNGQSVWEYRSTRPDENAIFNRAMTANSRGAIEAIIAAYDFSSFRHVADIGGGEGQLLAGILGANKGLRGTLFDQPHVVGKAAEVLNQHGVADRCEIVGGSFFESIPEGAEAYVMRAIIHDWDDKEAISILKTCRRAMTADARLLLIDVWWTRRTKGQSRNSATSICSSCSERLNGATTSIPRYVERPDLRCAAQPAQARTFRSSRQFQLRLSQCGAFLHGRRVCIRYAFTT
ncbi:methyltransferase [Bradyrhizobium sp. BRP23]|uniref:methyltransferase n=1 Tax=Bradyrhizobium sp. BRP23 TaxID=2793820 RepID=UPI001CD6094A|nr:methyltransferase [Bradyrhizobium sp. BRP23]